MSITRETMDKIRDAANIVDIVGESGIKLKKSGVRYKCCCPFHDDHSPSLVIYPATNSYKLGCKVSRSSFSPLF